MQYRYRSTADAISGATTVATPTFIAFASAYDAVDVAIVVAATNVVFTATETKLHITLLVF